MRSDVVNENNVIKQTICHPERSEGSHNFIEILRFYI